MASIKTQIVPISKVDPSIDVENIVNNLKVGDQLRLRREVTPNDPNVIGLHVSPDNVLWTPGNDLIGYTEPTVSTKISPLLQRGTTVYCHVTNVIQKADRPADIVVEIDFPYLPDTHYFSDIKPTFGDRVHTSPSTLTPAERSKLNQARQQLRQDQQFGQPQPAQKQQQAPQPATFESIFQQFVKPAAQASSAKATSSQGPPQPAIPDQRRALQRSCLMIFLIGFIFFVGLCVLFSLTESNIPALLNMLN